MTETEKTKGTAVAALQLSQYLFMHLVNRGIIDATEANIWLERGISLNQKGTEPHQQAAEILEQLRMGLFPKGSPPPEVK